MRGDRVTSARSALPRFTRVRFAPVSRSVRAGSAVAQGRVIFLFSEALWLLVTVPALLAVYAALLRRREKQALCYSCISQLRQAARSALIARHAPALLVLLAIVLLLVAGARPAVVSANPDGEAAIVFAVDVSYSMGARDVEPTRLAAAQALITRLLKVHPGGMRIALVAFGQYADVVQPPTPNYADIVAGLRRMRFEYGSGLGTGIAAALVTFAPETDLGYNYDLFGGGRPPSAAALPGASALPATRTTSRGGAGAIVLLSDGGSTSGMLIVASVLLVSGGLWSIGQRRL